MNKSPLISVIIPCFNTAKYLPETLDSLFNQTLQDFEVIAIDDGSSDNTLQILKEYEQKYSNMKVLTQQNQYCIIARMNGIQFAQGKYLVCLDSDDILHPEYLEKCSAIAEKDESVSIVFSDVQLFGAKNQLWKTEFNIEKLLLDNGLYITSLIRKSHFDAVGGFDTNLMMYEDWDVFISIIKNGGKTAKIEETLFYYRQREEGNSVCNTASEHKKSDNMLKIFNKHYDFYKENGLFFSDLMNGFIKNRERNRKHYNFILRKYYYKWFKPKRFQEIYTDL